jgi:hypothetical protein
MGRKTRNGDFWKIPVPGAISPAIMRRKEIPTQKMKIPDGFVWDEVVPQDEALLRDNPLNRALLSLLLINDGTPHLIGTAFVVHVEGSRAIAISAAHCFEWVRKILDPAPAHHSSALPEFLPPPKELDLKHMRGLYVQGGKTAGCTIESAVWDREADFAILTVVAPQDDPALFKDFFLLDDTVPAAGGEVSMIGFGEMKSTTDSNDSTRGIMQRRLVIRIGRVEEVYPQGHYMLKAPCVQTSIAVFPGMSGGIVTRGWPYSPDSLIQPFAFISHSMTVDEPQATRDRSISGRSFAAILDMKKTLLPDMRQTIEIPMNNVGVGRCMDTTAWPAPFKAAIWTPSAER